ncbi:MAG: NUDIX domain-containing protein [Clostridia bacterium]|nr:NUDIX domain-containing protein [Clostridia bacterium]
MKYVKSCGFVVFKQTENENYYLIIKSSNEDVGFPKGHMEKGETELQTAIRELKEETNVEIKVVDGFRRQIEYKIPKTVDTIKQCVYFLGICTKDEIICQAEEVTEAAFMPYEKALSFLTFTETKDILTSAQEFINKIKQF